jgi:hypothetical protein
MDRLDLVLPELHRLHSTIRPVMRYRVLGLVLLAATLLATTRVQAQEVPIQEDGEKQKRAQTGMKFTSLSIHPRAAALGNAVTSLELGSSSMFYNPAALSRMDQAAHVSLGQVQWIADITYNAGTVAFRPGSGQYGVFGLSLR